MGEGDKKLVSYIRELKSKLIVNREAGYNFYAVGSGEDYWRYIIQQSFTDIYPEPQWPLSLFFSTAPIIQIIIFLNLCIKRIK